MGARPPKCKRKGFPNTSPTRIVWSDNKPGQPMNMSKKMDEAEVLKVELEVLKREHRDLDEAIHALEERGTSDILTVRRLKKQKLLLKDKIARIEDRLLPDIIA